jgi:hypothetical protein
MALLARFKPNGTVSWMDDPELRNGPERALYDAAIAAEQATGVHENTERRARTYLVVRLARMLFGYVVLLAGMVLVVLPGPGLVLILAGLSILAVDVPFAARLRTELVSRADRATGFVPKPIKVALIVAGAGVGVAASVVVLLR